MTGLIPTSDGFEVLPGTIWKRPRKFINIDISSGDPSSGLLNDIFEIIGRRNGQTPWSNPIDEVRCAMSTPSTSGFATGVADRGGSDFYCWGSNNSVDYAQFTIDFDHDGSGRAVNLDGLFWQSGASNFPYQFVVEVTTTGESLLNDQWVTVATVNDFGFIPPLYGWTDFLPLTKMSEPYRFLRVRATGKDNRNFDYIHGRELLLGGEYYPGDQGY